MAYIHPMTYGYAIQDKPSRQDLLVYCGTTFIHSIYTTWIFPVNWFFYNFNRSFADNLQINEYKDNTWHGPCYDNMLYDKMVLNIRAKTNNWSALGQILWTMDLPIVLWPFKDEGRPPSVNNMLTKQIEIPADITAQMLQKYYTYELILEFNNLGEDLPEAFHIKTMCAYGDIITKQVGEI